MHNRVIDINNYQLNICQDLSYGYAGEVWDGALVLTHFIINKDNNHSINFENKTILELGSGTGICGLTAAMKNAKKVYITDKEIGLANSNYLSNISIFPTCSEVKILPLDWTKKEEYKKIEEKFDFILCSDIIWKPDLFTDIINVMDTYTIAHHTQIILVYTYREQRDMNFFKKLKEDTGKWLIDVIPENCLDEDYRADDIVMLKIVKLK